MNNELRDNICESCNQKTISFANLNIAQAVNLCQLCAPWVLGSIYKAPDKVNQIKIDDADLFIRMLKATNNFEEPQNENEWFELLKAIHPNKRSVLDEIEMQLDYRESCKTGEQLTGIEILGKIRKHATKLSTLGEERRLLFAEGWHLPKEIDWRKFEILQIGLHEIQLDYHEFGPKCGIKEIDSIKISGLGIEIGEQSKGCFLNRTTGYLSDELFSELIFESVNSLSPVFLSERISIMSDVEKVIKTFEFDYRPWIPYVLEHLVELIAGNQGKKLQYKLLAMIYQWKRKLKVSHTFVIRNKEIWTRAFQFLRGVITGLGADATSEVDGIRIRGNSGMWYKISPSAFTGDSACWFVKSERDDDSICIELVKEHWFLPLGDRIAALILSLHDDLGTMHLISTLEP